MSRRYFEPHPEDGFTQVREWNDDQLQEEMRFLLMLTANVVDEVAFRADYPDHRDGTGTIDETYSELTELVDEIEGVRETITPYQSE